MKNLFLSLLLLLAVVSCSDETNALLPSEAPYINEITENSVLRDVRNDLALFIHGKDLKSMSSEEKVQVFVDYAHERLGIEINPDDYDYVLNGRSEEEGTAPAYISEYFANLQEAFATSAYTSYEEMLIGEYINLPNSSVYDDEQINNLRLSIEISLTVVDIYAVFPELFEETTVPSAREEQGPQSFKDCLKLGVKIGSVGGAIVGGLIGYLGSGANPATGWIGAIKVAGFGASVGAIAGGTIGAAYCTWKHSGLVAPGRNGSDSIRAYINSAEHIPSICTVYKIC